MPMTPVNEGFIIEPGPVAKVIFNRPERRNAMDLNSWLALGRRVPELAARDDVKIIVFTGAGGEAFVAGGDISEFPQKRMGLEQAETYQEAVVKAMEAIIHCAKPTVAKIRGACVGGGLELAACCDLRVAAEDARFGIPIARIGVLLGWREMQRVVQLIGPAATVDMLLTGRLMGAEEALSLGLIHYAVPSSRLADFTVGLVESVLEGSPMSHRVHKQMLNILLQDPALGYLTEGEKALPLGCFESEDYKEGVDAFLTKRRPRFVGR